MADKSSLLYDISKLKPKETVLGRFESLREYPVFEEHGADENDPFLRFTVWYADKGSEYRDLPLELKKQKCLVRAGIADDDPRRAEILAWRDKGVVAMVNQYVRLLNDLDYASWFHSLIGIYDSLEQVSKHIDAKDLEADKEGRAFLLRHALIKEINTQRKDIKQLGNELFMSDEELRKASQDEVLNQTGGVEKRTADRTWTKKG